MVDIVKAREARARGVTKYPVRLEFPLGHPDSWNRKVVMLLLHESGEVSWDAAGFKEQETVDLDSFFGVASRPEAGGTS